MFMTEKTERREFLKFLLTSGIVLTGVSNMPIFFTGCQKKEERVEKKKIARRIGKKPNVILISIDTLRADHVGCYGYKKNITPNLDDFASEGIQFTRAICPFCSTLPSHISILTSLYPDVHRVISKIMLKAMIPEKDWHYKPFGISLLNSVETETTLDPGWTTLAEAMKRAGYITAGFVRSCVWMDARFGFDRGFDLYSVTDKNAEQLNKRVFPWLNNHKEDTFFLFIHYYDVHSDWHKLPYDSPSPYNRMFLPDYKGEFTGCGEESCASKYLLEINNRGIILPPEDRDYIMGMYDGGIRYTDTHIGELLKKIDRLGLRENTLVIIFSDHGEEFQEHGKLLHCQIYNELISVPLLMRYPEKIPPQRKVYDLTEGIDILPTVLDLVDIKNDSNFQGKSLVPLINGIDNRKASVAYGTGPLKRAVIKDNWKLLHDLQTGKKELYDLEKDPEEGENVAGVNNEMVKSMMITIQDWMKGNAEWRKRIERKAEKKIKPIKLKKEELERLKSLGYIQ